LTLNLLLLGLAAHGQQYQGPRTNQVAGAEAFRLGSGNDSERRSFMRQRSFRIFVSLCFLLLGVGAQGQYRRPKPDVNSTTPPTNADLAVYNGVSDSITVLVMNATPYDIVFQDWSITARNETEMTLEDLNRFMFVPVGIIPGLPEQDFLKPGDPGYVANYIDTTSHPYPVVFSFSDLPHSPIDPPANLDNWVHFTVKGVPYRPCNYDGSICSDPVSQDVQVGLWMYRNGTGAKQTAHWLPELKASLHAVFMTVALIGSGGEVIPLWIQQYLSMVELGKATAGTWSTSTENTRGDDGRKMWVASYVVPNPNSLCVLSGLACDPSTLTTTGDAVYSLWPARYAGPSPDGSHGPYSAAEANLVVEVGLLRGFKAYPCGSNDDICALGREPVVTVTVVRAQDFVVGAMAGLAPRPSLNEVPMGTMQLFLLQAGAGRIRELLEKQGRPGLLVLRSILQDLAPAQEQVLYEMVRTMGTGRLPTQQERLVVHLIADELKARLLHPQSH
jgi:hypothetical protein